MATPLDSVWCTLRPLRVTVTTRIKATGVDTIAAGDDRPEWCNDACAPKRFSAQATKDLPQAGGAPQMGIFQLPARDSAGSRAKPR